MYRIVKEGKFNIELETPSFPDRFKRLFLKGVKVVYVKNEFDNSTFRYRCYNVVQALENDTDYIVTYFLPSELEKVSEHLGSIDIIILQRTLWDVDIENFTYLARENNIPIYFDVDDLIYHPRYIPLYLNNLGILVQNRNSYIDYFYYASSYYVMATQCDGYIVTNHYLKDIVKEDFKKPVEIIPNFLNSEQEKHSKLITKTRKRVDEKFIIGYFSGSPSHKYDLDIVVDSIALLMERYEDIYFKIVGFIEIPAKLKRFGSRIIQVPFVSYEELQYEIGEVDLNIIPLQQNKFNNCKSELKYFEAGIVKVPSCCSPTYIYKKIISNCENGFLCRDGEWFSIIEKVYLGKYNLKEITDKAYEFSKSQYGVKNQKDLIKKVYSKILNS